MNDPNTKPGSKSPNPDTKQSDVPPSIDLGKFNESVAQLAGAIGRLEEQGKTRAEATAQVSQESGLSLETLAKVIDEADEKGTLGTGVLQVLGSVAQSFQAQSLDREGRREVTALKHHDDFSQPIDEANGKPVSVFSTYGPKFQEWMTRNKYSYATVADPDKAASLFRYFLVNETDYLNKRDAFVAKKHPPTKESDGAPAGKRATPSLRPGAAPEGGIGPRLVAGIYGEDAEATEGQLAVMDAFGMDDAAKKRATDAQRLKTPMGTPLMFVNTKNEGGV